MTKPFVKNISLLALILISTSPALGQAAKSQKLQDCSAAFSEKIMEPIPEGTEIKSLDQLPKRVFIASSADYLVEARPDGAQLWGSQSFLSGESKAQCATLKNASPLSFSMYAPTLLDLSKENSAGNSFWQFHLISTGQKMGIWNQKSRLAHQSRDALLSLQKSGIRIFGQSLSPSDYQILFVRSSAGTIEHLIIRYDLTDDLH